MGGLIATTQQFPLEPNNAFIAMITRFAVVFVIAAEVVVLLLLAASVGSDPEESAIILTFFFPTFAVLFVWGIRRSRRGVTEIHPDRLLIRTPAVTQEYPWRHVRRVEVISIRDAGVMNRILYRALGIDTSQRLVRLRLTRSLRQGLFRDRLGTDVVGIPAPGMKQVALFLKDPDAFVAAASPYLHAAGSYEAS